MKNFENEKVIRALEAQENEEKVVAVKWLNTHEDYIAKITVGKIESMRLPLSNTSVRVKGLTLFIKNDFIAEKVNRYSQSDVNLYNIYFSNNITSLDPVIQGIIADFEWEYAKRIHSVENSLRWFLKSLM
jgi:hypothetical protein